jgi:tRNA threonylcarbamoyladenosine biosynthesis protein TsaB
MIVLGIETSTARSSVALLADGELIAHEHHEDARGHGAFLAPAMRRCLDVAGARDGGAAIVDLVAVGTGPGLYTGLRVGMATAAAFASARGVPVAGVGGLDTLAAAVGPSGASVVTTLDARRGQVFWAIHAPHDGMLRCVEEPRVGSREELDVVIGELASGGVVHVIGEIAAEVVTRPDAADTARLAVVRAATTASELLVPAALTPVYLRDADVRIGWNERGGIRRGADGAS